MRVEVYIDLPLPRGGRETIFSTQIGDILTPNHCLKLAASTIIKRPKRYCLFNMQIFLCWSSQTYSKSQKQNRTM